MQKLTSIFLLFLALTSTALAVAPLDVVKDAEGRIQIDTQNPREITGCWDSDEQAVMFYRRADRTIFASEICNEPDEEHHGLGLTDAARARNYYDFLVKTRAEISAVKAPIVLGSLSGYNYAWLREFLRLADACELFDVLAFHPYHLGVAPDEIDAEKGAYHTVGQWVNFYREVLRNAGCEKPIWVTEFGFSTSDFDAEKAVSESEQTDFAVKQLVMLLGEGAERVSYFDKNTFQLSDAGATAWNELVGKLEGAQFVKMEMSGEKYCPRSLPSEASAKDGGSCFYDENEYRLDTGKSFFGLPEEAIEMRKVRNYVFEKDGEFINVKWETEKPGVEVASSPFADTTLTSPHGAAIFGIAERGIIAGYPDGTFRAENSVNRAEFLKMLVAASGADLAQISGTNCFPDVRAEWFAPAVCYAAARGWVGGYPDGNFQPANPVNLAEALKMITEAFDLPLGVAEGAWYEPFVSATRAADVLLADEAENFGNTQNRGFIAELIWRALGK